MNDIGYENLNYKNSVGYTTVISLNVEQLQYRKGYTEGAIEFHIKNNNPRQVAFFTEELNLINKRLKKK